MTQTLLHAGVVNAILATLLAMMVALLARLFRGRPALVHGLWLLVLLKLVTPPVVPLPLPWLVISDPSPVSLSPAPPAPLPDAERGEQEARRASEGNRGDALALTSDPSPPAPLPEAERGEEDSKPSQTALSSTADSPSPLRGGGWGERGGCASSPPLRFGEGAGGRGCLPPPLRFGEGAGGRGLSWPSG